MTLEWAIQPSWLGAGAWFVAETADGVQVLAPPGVRVTAARWEGDSSELHGWRLARWRDPGERHAVVDADPPDELSVLSGTEAVGLLGHAWAADVRRLLVEQLDAADAFGRPPCGSLLREGDAQAAAVAAVRALAALEEAFPDEQWRVAKAPLHAELVPDTVDALLESLPSPRDAPPRDSARALMRQALTVGLRHAGERWDVLERAKRPYRAWRAGQVKLATVDARDHKSTA